MKKAVSFLLSAAMLFILSIVSFALDPTFELTPGFASHNDTLEYMTEQNIYRFRKTGDITAEISVNGGVYMYVTLGGYLSESNGVNDNGINCVSVVHVDFFDENGEKVVESTVDDILVPADGSFRRYTLGRDDMYMGIPETAKTMRISVRGENETAYIKNLYAASNDKVARNISVHNWEIYEMGNINADTSRMDYWIMVGFVFAVAVIMMVFAKAKSNIKNKNKV